MANELTTEELDQLDQAGLLEKLGEAKKELFNLRFQKAVGQLEGGNRIQVVRKDIARIHTVIRERELNIRTAPTAKD